MLVIVLSDTPRTGAAAGAAGVASASFVARPITRTVLQGEVRLAMNLSLESPLGTVERWVVGGVTAAGQPVTWAAASSNTVPWSLVVLEQPARGWIDPSTPLAADAAIELVVTMTCDGAAVLLVSVEVPAPGVRAFANQVATVSGFAQAASVLAGGASSGSAVGRVMATRSMVLCDSDSAVGGGVIDLRLIVCASEAPVTTRSQALAASRSRGARL